MLVALVAGCSDEIPSSTDPGLIPITVETFEVTIPFEDFGRELRVDGGYGSPSALSVNRIVFSGDGGLEVRPLLRFAAAPSSISVFPPDGSQTVADTAAVATGGRVTLQLDTIRLEGVGPFELTAGALTQEWDHLSASWTHAVDTLQGREPWSVPGGGEPRPLDELTWIPEEGNSWIIELDSLTAAEWADLDDLRRGLIVSSSTPDSRIRISSASLQLDLRSSVNPDTTVQVTSPLTISTMILDQEAAFADGRMLVGGAPAFRSTFRVQVPDSVTTSGAICAGAESCRVALTADRVIFAGFGFRTIPQEPPSLAPADSMVLDLRPVLSPERLPRSPLGVPILPQGRTIGPGQFVEGGEALIEIPATRFIRDLARASAGDSEQPPSVVSLISAAEPSGIGVASFGGPGSGREPVLRIILTASEGVTLP